MLHVATPVPPFDRRTEQLFVRFRFQQLDGGILVFENRIVGVVLAVIAARDAEPVFRQVLELFL